MIVSTTKELKEYLINEDDGFLLNPDNNGKTIMLSGAWGAGKTHFWQNIIEPRLIKEFREDRACVYVSLYGKDSLQNIKQEVFIKASLDNNDNEFLSKEVSTFGFEALSSINNSDLKIVKMLSAFGELNKWRKSNKGTKKLKNGGIICFDDFERKSDNIQLNDLFGFISQLAIDMDCKVVIILNSDVFKGREANVFKTVKEKTVSKYLYYNPTPDELFKLVFYIKNSEEKYKYRLLRKYKIQILNTIKETEEVNARIYIQILDNCLEWIYKRTDNNILRQLVLCTIFFIKHHYSLGFSSTATEDRVYEIYDAFLENIEISQSIRRVFPQHASGTVFDTKDIIHSLKTDVTKKKTDNNDNGQAEVYYSSGLSLLEENKYMLRDFYHYKYILKVDNNIDDELFNEINKFIKTGILSKQITEVESSLPLEVVAETEA